ncbi:helix-turn-helix domain-containing protein [Roseofilum capinflatum]|jgi:DNA-binding Xre family transcriptional regulator|uniref:Helix-turn-helix transcriptional regulator n=1 Tax=Roseofilum capinflatum BLCC-M114 TaxID=3022440 RepID=A0ABT7B641_9CYAN|nr:helix-turn-helix transcriptional regulator [Roseofilum capinflatum]MDJ1174643.1 helix-turn-helix transcriptional regulator [Roseofilum capinflatum BLCC-M114]
MKVKSQLSQLKKNYGNVSNEEIAEVTGIDLEQIRELEKGSAEAIAFDTLAKLCNFFQCTPNDVLLLEWEGIEVDPTPPSAEELRQAKELIDKAFAIASAMPPRPAEEIWADFEATVDRIGLELEQSKSSRNGMKIDA